MLAFAASTPAYAQTATTCDKDPLYSPVVNAIRLGGKFTADRAVAWHKSYNCLGCHTQTQSLMGLASSFGKAKIDRQAATFLYKAIAGNQHADGSIWFNDDQALKTQTALGFWSLIAWPDKASSFPVMYKAAQYFHQRRIDDKHYSYWTPDRAEGWWNTNVAQTTLVVMGLADVLKTAPSLENTNRDTKLLPEFEKDVERATGYLLSQLKDNSSDKAVHALRLMGLAEARQVISKPNLLSRLDAAIYREEQWLRERQNTDGGWGRYDNTASDPLITAMVGLALFYTKPFKEDPSVRATVEHLLNTQYRDGSWINVNNGLTTRLSATSFVMAYLPKALEILACPPVVKVAPASCQFYAVHDQGKNHSQFIRFNVDSRLENFTVHKLGTLHRGYDIESLAIHPLTKTIYVASGDSAGLGKPTGYLYRVDAETGAIVPVGATGFEDVASLTFASDGTLWGWAKGKGLIKIDPTSGKGSLKLASDVLVEDLTLAKSEEMVFYGAVDTELWRAKPATNTFEMLCDNLPGETESLEMISDTRLLLGIHDGESLQVFDIESCKIIDVVNIPTAKFNDIEGIGVLATDCSLDELVDTAIKLAEEEPNQQVCLSLDELDAGDSVEGLGTVYPSLNISTSSLQAVKLLESTEPVVYYAGANDARMNGCLVDGFADKTHRHDYVFRFENGVTVTDFSVQLFDYGDDFPDFEPNAETVDEKANETADESEDKLETGSEISAETSNESEEKSETASEISLSLIAFDAKERLVSTDTLIYTMKEGEAFRDEQPFGTGDACLDQPGELGHYTFEISGKGINQVKLKFNNTDNQPLDPNFALGKVCFTLEKLPNKLLSSLPKEYVSDHLNEFIDEVQHKQFSGLSKAEIRNRLIELERAFFNEYIQGLPGELIRNFIETLPDAVPADYPDELLTEIIDELSVEFQNKLFEQVTRGFILEHLTVRLVEAHSKLQNDPYLPLLPVEMIRKPLAENGSDMMGKLTEDLVVDIDEEILYELLKRVANLSLDELLEAYDQ